MELNQTELIELAFETSLYVFAVLFIVAAIFVVWFLRWIFGERNPLAYFPQSSLPESRTLTAAKILAVSVKQKLKSANSEEQAELEADCERISGLLEITKKRLETEQNTCKKLLTQREELWKETYWLVQNLSLWEKMRGLKNHPEYQKMTQQYRELEERIDEEQKHLRTFDNLHLAELRHHSLYQKYQ